MKGNSKIQSINKKTPLAELAITTPWQKLLLKDILEPIETVKRNKQDPFKEFIYLDIGGIDNVSNSIQSYKKYSWKDAPSRAQQIVKTNDILFSTVRTYMRNIALVDKPHFNNQIASSGFCILRVNPNKVIPKFLFYKVISESFLRPLNKLQTGSSYPAVRDKDVLSQPISIPSIETQKAIVSKIEELFSELDKGIESLKLAQQQLKVYRQSVLKWAFEGRLTNENVKKGVLPEGWKRIKLGEILSVSSGRSLKVRSLSDGKYSVYGGNGINGFHSEYMFENGKLIIGRVGVKCGVTHITKPKSWITDNALIVDFKINEFNLTFFQLKLQFEDLNKLSVSTAQPVISGGKIYSLEINLPPIIEQNQIVLEIEQRISVADKMEESINQSLQQAEVMRQSTLKRAFQGQLVD